MLSKFFIDRPIFATVLSVVITLAGGLAVFSLPVAQYPRITPPSVKVSITYPGASAQVVADTVAAPIEQQVTGVPGMLYMSSQMGNDGSYTLYVTFEVGVDLNTALVMVQNRVQLAMPLLPTSVQNQGITIRKKTPDILMMISLFSPDEPLRRRGPEQFRPHQRQGRAAARGRRVGHQHHGRARLQHPRLARSAEAGVAQLTAMDVAGRGAAIRIRQAAGGADRATAVPRHHGFSCRSTRWAGSMSRAVRRHHRQGGQASARAREQRDGVAGRSG